MPFDSEGMFFRIHCWEDDRINDIEIVSDRHDEEDDNFADGLSMCFLKNGNSTMRGDVDCGNFRVKNVAKAVTGTDAINKNQLDKSSSELNTSLTELLNKLWRIGDIKASVKEENHDNWFLCNGQEISRVAYPELFSLIGIKFGSGDGTTTFNLPDYRGKFLRGLGGNSAPDIYTLQEESLPDHNHSVEVSDYGHPTGGSDMSDTGYKYWREAPSGSPQYTENASKTSAIYSGSHVTPENYAINYFIKVKEEK